MKLEQVKQEIRDIYDFPQKGIIFRDLTTAFKDPNALSTIADALKEQHSIEIDRKKISIPGEAIKEIGQHKAQVDLHRDVKAEITLDVYAE